MADHPASVSGAFRRPFAEQVAFFRQKMGNRVPTTRWDDLTGAQHDTAFMVAGAQKAELLTDLAASVDRAIAEGRSLDAFRRDFDAAVEQHDWHGWTGEDTKGGRAWRTRTIYRTNTYTAYAAGRRAQLHAAGWKFWVYLHGGSRDPRPEHLNVFNGLVLPPDHPFWDKHYPPSDWGCSCYVVGARSERGAIRLGGDPSKTLPDGWDKPDPATGEPLGVGKGWGYAPGASVSAAVQAAAKNWPAEIAADFTQEVAEQLGLDLHLPEAVPPITSVKQLDTATREAFVDYTGSGYRAINEGLRFGDAPTEQVRLMDAAFARSRLPDAMVLYRALINDYPKLLRNAGLDPGDILPELAFLSTSTERRVALDWRAKDDDGTGIFMIVRVPAGIGALDVVPIALIKSEREVLLQRGLNWRVLRWNPDEGELEVEIVGGP